MQLGLGSAPASGAADDALVVGLRVCASEAFGAVAEDLSSLLDQLKVPAKEKAEVMTLVGSLKPSIVQSSK